MPTRLLLSLGFTLSILAYGASAAPEKPIPPPKVDAPLAARHPDFALKFCRELCQFRGGARVQAELVYYFDFLFNHFKSFLRTEYRFHLKCRGQSTATLNSVPQNGQLCPAF